MNAAFEGRVEGGRLVVAELEHRMRFLEGKHIGLIPLETNEQGQVVGGQLVAGVLEGDALRTVEEGGKTYALEEFEGKPVMIVMRHEILDRVTTDVFDRRFQLGAKMGDLDD